MMCQDTSSLWQRASRAQKTGVMIILGSFLLFLLYRVGDNQGRRDLVGSNHSVFTERAGANSRWTSDLREVMPHLKSFAKQVRTPNGSREQICQVVKVGDGWGGHDLCKPVPRHCTFYSFGISKDYSFDVQMAEDFSCHGFAADPTVTHPSKLHKLVTFHQIGAKMLTVDRAPGRDPKGNQASWFSTSMPRLMKWREDERVDVLKMDCEGCEYSLAKDVAFEDPLFFEKVGQFAVEIHVTKVWLKSAEHLYSLGRLLQQLESAGLRLAHSEITSCAPKDEAAGCMDELADIGLPCGRRNSCHNFLFARSSLD